MSAQPLVELVRLQKHYLVERRLLHPPVVARAVEDVSLRIEAGKNLGLVGESGCGKSTLGRAALRLIEPSAGQVYIDGIEVTALSSAELRRFRRHAQIIFQDPYGSLNPRLRVADALAEPLRIHGLIPAEKDGQKRSSADVRDEEAARIGALLEQVGLPPDSGSRYPHEFSGGQRQRIVIARALAVEPRFIVADEAVSALDVSIQAQIINLLRDVQRKKGLTYLFISHDLKVVEHLCEQVAVMYLGRIVELADTPRLYGRPRHPYTQALLSAVPDPPDAPSLSDSAADAETLSRMPDVPIEALRHGRVLLSGEMPSILQPPTGCAFHPRCPRYAVKGQPAICRTETPVLRSMLDEHDPQQAVHRVACHLA
jgi:oligopeptide/dipeptide ABC transporter ATP-binding protein